MQSNSDNPFVDGFETLDFNDHRSISSSIISSQLPIEFIQQISNQELTIEQNMNTLFKCDNPIGLKQIRDSNQFDATIDEIYFNISSVIANEKNKLQSEKEYVLKAQKDFKDFETSEMAKISKEKSKLKQKFKLHNNAKESDIIDLNIGGTHEITTSRSTLIKFNKSILAMLFSGQQALTRKNNKVFIDREAEPFINVVNYLRNGKFPVLKSQNEEIKFYDELDYWKIPIYEGRISNSNCAFDPEWCSPSLTLAQNNSIVKKFNSTNSFERIDLQHGIVFCKQALDGYSVYIDFKITMNVLCKGKPLLFIGLANKSKCQTEHLSSKILKEFPNCYLWDIWNMLLIKTNEIGGQIGSMKGYGCQCENFETRIGMKYNHKSRSLAFYKNGIYLGVAFRNIPSGLTPCIDVWFDSATIEIIYNASSTNQVREFL